MTRTNLVALVVTHDRLAHLQVTLAQLLKSDSSVLSDVVVYDNASSGPTTDWLATLADPRVRVIRSDRNLGGAGGFEQGLRAVRQSYDADWVVLMDDDARPANNALETFLAAPRHDYDAWLAAVYLADGRISDMNRPWINPFRSLRSFVAAVSHGRDGFHLTKQAYDDTAVRSVDGGSFVGLFMSRAALDNAGYPDGRLFLYGDDVLYTLSLTSQGGTIGFDPNVRFEHDCSTLTGAGQATLSPVWKAYYFHRNQIFVYRAAAGPILIWPVVFVRSVQWVRRAAAYGANRWIYLRLIRLAIWDGITRYTGRSHQEILERSGVKQAD